MKTIVEWINSEVAVVKRGMDKSLFLKATALNDYEALDKFILQEVKRSVDLVEHNCDTFIDPKEATPGYFEKIAAIPYVISHPGLESEVVTDRPVHLLNPSICYHCFVSVKRGLVTADKVISSRGICRRHETTEPENPFRLTSFQMREYVFIGEADEVVINANAVFDIVARCIRDIVGDVEVKIASDTFLGQNAEIYQRYQKAMEVKKELIYRWDGCDVALASINLHNKAMSNAFFGPEKGFGSSSCVAIGLDRLFIASIKSNKQGS